MNERQRLYSVNVGTYSYWRIPWYKKLLRFIVDFATRHKQRRSTGFDVIVLGKSRREILDRNHLVSLSVEILAFKFAHHRLFFIVLVLILLVREKNNTWLLERTTISIADALSTSAE